MTEKIDNLDIDGIFTLLKESREKEVQDSGSTLKKNSKELTYEDLKRKVTHLPNIQVNIFGKDSKHNTVIKNNSRKIERINDSVESILPDLNKKTITDRRLIKEENSKKWFSLPKVEMTDELKRDMLIIKNRKYLDPKRFYKGEKWEIPENFQIGEIVEGVGEYAGRLNRKQKGKTLVDELLKNEDSSTWFDKTFNDIQKKKRSGGKKFLKEKIAKKKKY
ncbi:hypothetical protein C6P40_004850 [Pichia californica]|uniref:Fcf2 pre-rRNA processing C-terminal domain-containing protein n=1 Tax=Pichia californica TaxID=460514 RepID=A0A9P6WM39_9ASCO|nr:hypothetical protein C6P42_003126 [[Candida] californica]KAG0689547.1 hypothetical protein C6P40_004850 [[Candida] californica]